MRKEGFPGPATVTTLERPVPGVGRGRRRWSQEMKETPRRASFNTALFNPWVGEWGGGCQGTGQEVKQGKGLRRTEEGGLGAAKQSRR